MSFMIEVFQKYLFSQVLLLVMVVPLFAQNNSADNEGIRLARKGIRLETNQLYFNVVQLRNFGRDSIELQIKLVVPKEWLSMTVLPAKIVLAPSQKKFVPIRIRPPRNIAADTTYTVKVIVKDLKNIKETILLDKIGIKERHRWEIEAGERILYFSNDENFVDLSFSITNKGNVSEVINLEYSLSKELFIRREEERINSVFLKSGETTSITQRVYYSKIFKDVDFNNAGFKVIGKSATLEKSQEVKLIKMKSSYDRYEESEIKYDNLTGLNMRSYSRGNLEVGAFAKGKIKSGEDGNINYELSSRNLLSSDDFWRDNHFAFNYESDKLKFGLGGSSSMLGVDLYKRNSLFAESHFDVGDRNKLIGFVNTSISDKNSGGAIGHKYRSKRFSTLNSVAYNSNSSEKVYTKSAISESRISGDKSYLDYKGELFKREDKLNNTQLSKYRHRIRYQADIDKRTRLQVFNDVSLANTESENKFSSYAIMQATHFLNASGMSFTGSYSNRIINNKDNGIGVESKVNISNYSLRWALPRYKFTRFVLGTSINDSKGSENNILNTSKKTYKVFLNTNYQKKNVYYRSYLKYGVEERAERYVGSQRTNILDYEGRFAQLYNSLGRYKLGLRYKGYFGDHLQNGKEESLTVSAGIDHSFYGKKLKFSANGNYNIESNSDRKNYNVRLKMEAQLRRNLSFLVKGNFRSQSSGKKLALSSFEASMVMGFNSIDSRLRTYEVEAVFFKDVNANGVLDEGEELIENILASLKNEDRGVGYSSSIIIKSLMSDYRGRVQWKHLPEGSYKISFKALKRLGGYFNFNNSNIGFHLNKDKCLIVPYVMASKIYGSLSLKKSSFSALGTVDIGNIRVTAIDSLGREFSALTDKLGNYTIYVPKNREYRLSVKNIFGRKMELSKNNVPVSMLELDKIMINFEIREKSRRINFKRK